MDISVRRAVQGDLQFVSQDGYTKSEIVRRKIQQREVLLAEVDGEPVRYLRIELLWSIQPYLSLIRVLESYRGKGVGRSLLEHFENALRGEGHTVLFSSSQVDETEPQEW